jgi:hypothetical protein
MPRLSAIARAYRDFESQLDVLLELEGHIAHFAADEWKGQKWKVNWYCTMIALSAYSEWERLVEKIVISSLAANTVPIALTLGLSIPSKVSLDVSEALLTFRSGYVDFRGVEELIGQTRRWLSPNPFDKLTQSQKELLENLRIIRNAVIHLSRKARKDMQSRFGKTATPVSVLTAKTGGQTALRRYLNDLRGVSKNLQKV